MPPGCELVQCERSAQRHIEVAHRVGSEDLTRPIAAANAVEEDDAGAAMQQH